MSSPLFTEIEAYLSKQQSQSAESGKEKVNDTVQSNDGWVSLTDVINASDSNDYTYLYTDITVLEQKLSWVKTYNHLEFLIAYLLCAPTTLYGFVEFVASASYGDIDFSLDSIQLIEGMAVLGALGITAAAFFVKYMHSTWQNDANSIKDKLIAKLTDSNQNNDNAKRIITALNENYDFAYYNWLLTTNLHEFSKIGFYKDQVKQEETSSLTNGTEGDQLAQFRKNRIAFQHRQDFWKAVAILLNAGGVVGGMLTASLIHQRKSNIPQLPDFPDLPDLPNLPDESELNVFFSNLQTWWNAQLTSSDKMLSPTDGEVMNMSNLAQPSGHSLDVQAFVTHLPTDGSFIALCAVAICLCVGFSFRVRAVTKLTAEAPSPSETYAAVV